MEDELDLGMALDDLVEKEEGRKSSSMASEKPLFDCTVPLGLRSDTSSVSSDDRILLSAQEDIKLDKREPIKHIVSINSDLVSNGVAMAAHSSRGLSPGLNYEKANVKFPTMLKGSGDLDFPTSDILGFPTPDILEMPSPILKHPNGTGDLDVPASNSLAVMPSMMKHKRNARELNFPTFDSLVTPSTMINGATGDLDFPSFDFLSSDSTGMPSSTAMTHVNFPSFGGLGGPSGRERQRVSGATDLRFPSTEMINSDGDRLPLVRGAGPCLGEELNICIRDLENPVEEKFDSSFLLAGNDNGLKPSPQRTRKRIRREDISSVIPTAASLTACVFDD